MFMFFIRHIPIENLMILAAPSNHTLPLDFFHSITVLPMTNSDKYELMQSSLTFHRIQNPLEGIKIFSWDYVLEINNTFSAFSQIFVSEIFHSKFQKISQTVLPFKIQVQIRIGMSYLTGSSISVVTITHYEALQSELSNQL